MGTEREETKEKKEKSDVKYNQERHLCHSSRQHMTVDRLLKQPNSFRKSCDKFIMDSGEAKMLSNHSQYGRDQNQHRQIQFGPNNCQVG